MPLILSHLTCPEFLNFEAMAPPTALSTSALSNTMKGAWPPSSMDAFFTVSAAILSNTCVEQKYSSKSSAVMLLQRRRGVTVSWVSGVVWCGALTFPVAVDPVKEILATRGSVQRTSPTDGVFSLEQGTTLNTPAGIPACSASCSIHDNTGSG